MQSDPESAVPRKLPRFLRFILGEAFLGLLAIVAAALTLIPLLFKVSPAVSSWLEAGQWVIIGLFALEYATAFAAARQKRQFALDPWRLVDAATIVIPLITLLPGASDWLRSTPVLRLVRLARLLSLGMRAGGAMVRQEKPVAAAQSAGPVQVHKVTSLGDVTVRGASWEEFIRWAKQPGPDWYSVSNVSPSDLTVYGHATDVPPEFISSRLFGLSYPHLEVTERFVALFVQMPESAATGQTERRGLLVLASASSVVTFSRFASSVVDRFPKMLPDDISPRPFPVRMICQLLRIVLDSNEQLVGQFERDLASLEELPVRESRPKFFERTFRLKKELSAAQSDLWRLRGVLKELAESRVKLPGSDGQEIPLLRDLEEAVDYLYETVNNVREGVLSLIDLHLNVVSFEMNRVMRVLAVVSVLGLIPAVIGGLFGMNLADNPWPFTLPQVTFAVGMAMITCLYFFIVKGWLR